MENVLFYRQKLTYSNLHNCVLGIASSIRISPKEGSIKNEHIIDSRTGIPDTLGGGYYLPYGNLPNTDADTSPIGVWGRRRKRYPRQHFKAAYNNDLIPVYGEEASAPVFSGRRAPRKYKGMTKESGFRGLYVTGEKTIVNADLNGSANIGRKVFPELFNRDTVSFASDVLVFRHPDYAGRKENQLRQKQEAVMSHAKQKRLKRKNRNVSA